MGKKKKPKDLSRPERPEALPLPVIDNHTHLDHENPAEVPELLDAARSVNVIGAVQIGCDVASSQRTVELVNEYSNLIGAVAIHPNVAPELAVEGKLDEALGEIEKLVTEPGIHVVGESGLDYFRTDQDSDALIQAQQESFRWHIDLAKRHDKVLQIHCRDAMTDTLRILDEEGAPEKTIFHCFSGDVESAQECIDKGYYLSFAGNITFKTAQVLRDALEISPIDRTLVETDAPYLTAMPFRGRPNASYLIPLTVQEMANVRGKTIHEVCEGLSQAATALYGDWQD